jgi:hypothetical protein
MLIVNEMPGKFPAVIDNTMRSAWNACPTKFYWEFCRQLGPKGGSVDLIAGGAFAQGLEVARKAFWKEKKTFEEAQYEGMMAAIAEYGNFECPEHKQQKSVQRVVQAIEYYFYAWPMKTDPVQPYYWGDGNPAVEFSFSIPLDIAHPDSGEPIIYAGRLDMIGVFNEQIFLIDEKTTSQLGTTWGQKWNLRSQFTGYTWAARKTGLSVAGTIVRGISFLKNSFGHAQSIQFRPEWQCERWFEQLNSDIRAMVSDYQRRTYNQNLADSCESYGGCAYMRLCESKNPEDWIGEYQPRIWNPLDRYPSGKPKQEDAEVIPLGFTLGQ